ncbi:MAG: alpha/beta hydrolase [Desulfobacteraceae bacterium]|nr:alpha/beta hydrolase [Desulfobacteraceae bacterium]
MAEKIYFTNHEGHTLSGMLEMPGDGKPEAYCIFAHCFTCTKNIKAAVNISRALAATGIAVLRFDFTGLGESEGDFTDTNFSSNVDDLMAAAAYLAKAHEPPQIMIGHSLGGAAVLMAAGKVDRVKAVVTIGAPGDPNHLKHLLTGKEAEIKVRGVAEVMLAGRTFTIKKQFLDDLDQPTFKPVVRRLDKALLVLHSPLDEVVSIENAAEIFRIARHPKSFISLDTADHLLSDAEDSRYAGSIIAAWANRYI